MRVRYYQQQNAKRGEFKSLVIAASLFTALKYLLLVLFLVLMIFTLTWNFEILARILTLMTLENHFDNFGSL